MYKYFSQHGEMYNLHRENENELTLQEIHLSKSRVFFNIKETIPEFRKVHPLFFDTLIISPINWLTTTLFL